MLVYLVQKIQTHYLSAVGRLESDHIRHNNFDMRLEYRVADLRCSRRDNHSVPRRRSAGFGWVSEW